MDNENYQPNKQLQNRYMNKRDSSLEASTHGEKTFKQKLLKVKKQYLNWQVEQSDLNIKKQQFEEIQLLNQFSDAQQLSTITGHQQKKRVPKRITADMIFQF